MQECWEVQSCPFLEKVAVAKISENGCNLVCTFFPLAFGHFTAAVCSVASENCRGPFLFNSVADDWQFS